MVAIINGSRITPPKPDISIPNPDPNTRLTVINNPTLITEEEKNERKNLVKVASFTPDKLSKFARRQRLDLVRNKQRRGEVDELKFRVLNKQNRAKQQNLKSSRFNKEVGKGSILDVSF